jgi:hypothetical protein
VGKTFDVILKRASDGLTIQGLLADNKGQRGSMAYSSDVPGKPGRVVMESFHKGSGQRNVFQLTTFDRNYQYNKADGWDATRAGHVRSIPAPGTPTQLTAAYPVAGDQGRAEIFNHQDAGEVIITPYLVFEAGVIADTAPAGYRYTGSYAVFGDRIFFGMEAANATRESRGAARVRTGAGSSTPLAAFSLTTGSSSTPGAAITERSVTSDSNGPHAGPGGLAVVETSLQTLVDTVSRSVYTVPTYTPTANALVLVSVAAQSGISAGAPTLVGNSITWVQVATEQDPAFPNHRLTVFRGQAAAPTAGTLVVTFPGSQGYCMVSVSQYANAVVDLVGNGAGAVLQSQIAITNLVTLAAMKSGSATYGAFFGAGGVPTFVTGNGFTATANLNSLSGSLLAEWKNTPDVTVDAVGSGIARMGIALEIGAITSLVGSPTFSTAPVVLSNNALELLYIFNTLAAGATAVNTVTGCGVTWVLEKTVTFLVANAGRLSVYRALGTPTPGAISIDFGGVSQDYCRWSLSEYQHVDTTGANGAGAVVQSVSKNSDTAATSSTITLAAFGNASNAAVGGFATNATSGITPSLVNEIHDVLAVGGLETQWQPSEPALDKVTGTDSAAATVAWAGIALELKLSAPVAAFGTAPISPAVGRLQLAAIHNNSTVPGASIVQDATVTEHHENDASTTPLTTTFNHTITTGIDKLLVRIMFQVSVGAVNISGVTWNGIALTAMPGSPFTVGGSPHDMRIEYWYLDNPATGTHSIAITRATTAVPYGSVVTSYAGVTTGAAGFGTARTASHVNVSSTTLNLTITGAATDLFVSGVLRSTAVGGGLIATDVTNGQTLDSLSTGTNVDAGGNHMPGLASVNMGWHGTNPSIDWFMVAIPLQVNPAPSTPTLSGCGLTWTQVDTATAGAYRMTVFKAYGAPTGLPAPLAIDFGGVTQTAVRWAVDEFAGINPATLVVNHANATGTGVSTLTVNLPAFANAANGTYGAFGASTVAGFTPGLGFAKIDDLAALVGEIYTESKLGNDQTVDASSVGNGTWVGVAVELGGTAAVSSAYSDTDFPASYFAVIGSRLFRAMNAASYPKVSAAWTDQVGSSTPLWFTAYTYPTEQFVMDAADLRGAFIMAIGGIHDIPGEVVTLDVGGNFTNVVPAGVGFAPVLRFISYNGGQICLVRGEVAECLYMDDVQTISPLAVHPTTDGEVVLPLLDPSLGCAGLLAASTLDTVILGSHLPAQGLMGTSYMRVDDTTGRITAHNTPVPSGFVAAADIVLGARLITHSDATRDLDLIYLTGAGLTTLNKLSVPLPNGNILPAPLITPDVTGDFTTSEYLGSSYGLKQLLAISARAQVLPGPPSGAGLIFTLHMILKDGTLTNIILPSLNLAGANLGGPFHIELGDTALCRAFYLTWAYTDAGNNVCDVLCPIVVDYFEMPTQRTVASLPLLAGSLQITRTGTFTKQSRKVILDNIETALLDPSEWTIEWRDDPDGQPSWTVLIESFKAVEVEEPTRPGEGAALATLTVRRLNTAARAI